MSFSQRVSSKLSQFLIATLLFSCPSVMASLSQELPESTGVSEACVFYESQSESEVDHQVVALVEVSDENSEDVLLHEIPMHFCTGFAEDADTVRMLHFAGGEYSGGNLVPAPKKKRK